MQARHAHRVQGWASLCVRFVPRTRQRGLGHCVSREGHGLGCAEAEAEASCGALQAAITTYDGNPLAVERTGARHEDGRLGRLWNRHDLEEVSEGPPSLF